MPYFRGLEAVGGLGLRYPQVDAAAGGATDDHVKKVAEYFAGTVQSAKRYLREKEGVVSELASEERGSDVEDSGERWGLGVEEGSGEGRRS